MKLKATLMAMLIGATLAPAVAQERNEERAAEIQARIERGRADMRSEHDAGRAQGRSEADLAELRARLAESQQVLAREQAHIAEISRQLALEALDRADWKRVLAPRPRLGLVLGENDGPGLRIAAVTPDGPAARAGLQAGDRLLDIEGRALTGDTQASRLAILQEALESASEGQPVRIGYQREGKRLGASVVPSRARLSIAPIDGAGLRASLARLRELTPDALIEFEHLSSAAPFTSWCLDPDDCLGPAAFESLRWRGLRLATLEPKLGRYFGSEVGVLVLADRDGLLPGLEPGDVILGVDGEAVDNQRQLLAALGRAEAGRTLRLDLLRERKKRGLDVVAPARPPAEDLLRRLTPPAPPAPPAPPRQPRAPAPPPPADGGQMF
jgi:membrane-associated protease RseP (regulator of RpoE activity)